jgi:2',3'-cyclic-nucleotide 2'-phosphodiesterase (5'-nucleotidase family)
VPIFEIASLMRLDASTLGNHEFDYGWLMIPRYVKTARFPIVSANVVDSHRVGLIEPYVVLEANEVRVGVIGVLTSGLRYLTLGENRGPWRVEPAARSIRRFLPEVREQSEIVVVLGHLEDHEEVAVLERFPEVAAVIAGHGHAGLAEPTRVGGRPLVRVEGYGRQLGRLDLEVDVDAGEVVDWKWRAIEIDAGAIEPDRKVARRVAKWEKRVSRTVDAVIGESARPLDHGEVKQLLERVMREATAADLAYVNPAAIRDTIPEGELLVRHAWNVMPFEDHVVTGKIRGSEIPADVAEELGVDPSRSYRLTTLDFVAGLWRDSGEADLAIDEVGPLARDLLVEWIRENRGPE